MRILVIRFSSLGDVILSSAVLRGLLTVHPNAEIVLATKELYTSLFESFHTRLRVAPLSAGQSLKEYSRGLGREPFDLVIDLHGSLRSRLLCARIKSAQIRRVRKHSLRRWRMVWSKRGLDRPIAVVDSYLQAAALTVGAYRSRLALAAHEQAVGEQDGSRLRIGIGWGARHSTKVVPPSVWEEILRTVRDRPLELSVYGAAADESDIAAFLSRLTASPREMSVRQFIDLPLSKLMGQIGAEDIFMSSDSGLMHLADALGVPTFGFFGPTHPALGFSPTGERSRAFHAGIWCSPCHRHGSAPCFRERRYCFDQLDVGGISLEIAAVIKRRSQPPAQAET